MTIRMLLTKGKHLTTEMSSSLNEQYRPDIDGLRAIAVLAVVLHHAFPSWFKGGFVGVDIFFVISGYLISSIIFQQLQRNTFRFSDFYARRIRRIFPALILVLGAVLGFGWWWLTPSDYRLLAGHTIAGSAFVANFVFWNEAGYFDAASTTKVLLHLWSLAIEEQFYLIWPLVLYALHRWRWHALRAIFVLLLFSFAVNMAWVKGQPEAAFYNPLARFWELLVGALLAAMHAHQTGWRGLLRSPLPFTPPLSVLPSMWRVHALSTIGLLLLISVFVQVHPDRTFPGGWALLPTGGAVLLIAAGPRGWFNRYVLARRPLVWVGLISYPLYLWHWPFLAFSNLRSGVTPDWSVQLGWVALSIVLAWLTYVLVEIPIRFGRWNRRVVTGVLVGLMSLIAVLGTVIHHNKGFESRFPPIVRDMTGKGGPAVVTEGWRYHDCILDFRVPPTAYKPFCIETRRPLIFLWGDSHAASLYPGFKALQDSGKYTFGLGERAGAICPPVLGIEPRPGCKALNDANIQAIRDSRPDVVVLYAWWHHKRYDLKNLEATVAEIRKAGVPRIILLGAVPYWQRPLPQLLLEAWKKGPFSQPPPLRLKDGEGLDPELRAVTESMRARAIAMDIEFISGLDYFCNQDSCLTRLGDNADQPLSYDYGHLSLDAVRYYVEQIAPLVLKNP